MNTNEKTVRHTAGPWKVYQRSNEIHVGTGGRKVAVIDWDDINAEDEANAKLLSASPDLLEALQAAVKILEINNTQMVGLDGKEFGQFDEVLIPARSAIARATGETI